MNANPKSEPLPIWFFVGLILAIYGSIILLSGLFGEQRLTKLVEIRPAVWWGGLTLVSGLVFLLIGWVGYKRSSKKLG